MYNFFNKINHKLILMFIVAGLYHQYQSGYNTNSLPPIQIPQTSQLFDSQFFFDHSRSSDILEAPAYQSEAVKRKRDSTKLNSPKHAITSYGYFSREAIPKIKQEMGSSVSQSDIFSIVANKWKEMTDEQKAEYGSLVTRI